MMDRIPICRFTWLSSTLLGTPTLRFSGDVYDVSANRRIYGPGGGYGFFAGKDAARAFVTGCFKEDLTHDIRGLDPKQMDVIVPIYCTYSWIAADSSRI
jgi:hypothetical protein